MSGRTMKFPYTIGAQVTQFPFAYYFNKSWVFKSWVIGSVLTFPIMVAITNSIPDEKPKGKKDH
ncbi:hypothetical protein TCAL_10955 [Tigriopus californicus]|uniref:Uncharacterized protein n=1 Tax=Tigriopus californicus TaxID=6832 RepID=A0A553NES1_TIGCA|nr:hypothetical protein TCAL_10955 [Tigriopus californicus]|eukprot:TCALIF_10955-PA protein Name:"Protein of unknown function" AED:0.00 eAED:0.00 QI:78/1/1/1/0/0/3/216/63